MDGVTGFSCYAITMMAAVARQENGVTTRTKLLMRGTGGRTMDDLISRAALLAEYDAAHKGPPGKARKLMEEAPAVDAVPVVRCRDCINYGNEPFGDVKMCYRGLGYVKPSDYCSNGERREEE